MKNIIQHIDLKFRMMNFDSLTKTLNRKLLEWASHQYPPQNISSKDYLFIQEGPNSGGYSRTWFSYKGIQSLQYFTRHLSTSTLSGIINTVDTMLTCQELKNIMLPVADIDFHDTFFSDD